MSFWEALLLSSFQSHLFLGSPQPPQVSPWNYNNAIRVPNNNITGLNKHTATKYWNVYFNFVLPTDFVGTNTS